MKLGLEQDVLEAIQKSHRSDEECFKAMLKQMVTNPYTPTLSDVLKVITPGDILVVSPEDLPPGTVLYAAGLPSQGAQVAKVNVHNPATGLPVYTNMPAIERQQLIVSLQEQTLAIRKEFADLVPVVMEEFRRSQRSLALFMQFLGFCSSGDYDETLSVSDVFRVAIEKGYWSFFKYDRLKCVRTFIGHEVEKQQGYDEHFGEYCKRRVRLCKFPSDGAAVEEKVVFLMDNKMGLQRSAKLELRQLQSQVSEVTGFRVSKLVWIEDDLQEPTFGAELSDKGEGVEESCSARELDSAPTIPQPREPCPPLQRYLPKRDED